MTRLTVTHWGAYLVSSDGSTISAVDPFPDDPNPSPIGRSLVDSQRNRVMAPAVRQSWLLDGPGANRERRGREPFVEVEWERAIELVAAELGRVRDNFGNSAIYGGSYGWASAGRFHHAQSQIHRFLSAIGGYVRSVNSYSLAAAEVIVPHVVGYSYDDVQSMSTSLSVIADSTDLVVAFGGIPAKNAQVQHGGHGQHVTSSWLSAARKRGTRFVGISPVRDDLGPELDADWIPIRPNTDVALILGLVSELQRIDAVAGSFLATHCVGWEKLAGSLTGQSDGVVKDAKWASEITEVPIDRIVKLAQEMASGTTMINASWSLQRAHHGEQAFWAVIALAAVLGQIGTPGGGFALGYGAVGSVGNGALRRRLPSLGRRPNAVDDFIPVARIADMLLDPGGSYRYDGQHRRYPQIELIYWSGGNPFHHHQDLNRLVEAWSRPATVIVNEPYWTSTARHADIVLPVTTSLEREDLGGASDDDHLFWMEKILPAPGEARDEYEVLSDLAERLGVRSEFTSDRSSSEWIAELYRGFAESHADAPSFDEFRRSGWIRHGSTYEIRRVLLEEFRADPIRNPLPTPSGRIELWSENIASFSLDDCPPLPTWLEPFEWLGNAEPDELHLISHQPAGRLHSQLDFGATSQQTKIGGREPVHISPVDAVDRGLSTGDVVRLWNTRGTCLAAAVIDDDVRPGVVVLATGAWFDPGPDGECRHGNPNVLTADRPTSNLAQGPSAQTCLVRLERVSDPVPPPDPYRLPEFSEGR